MVEQARRRRGGPVVVVRVVVAVALLALVATGLVLAGGSTTTWAEPLPPHHPSRLTSLGDARQVVVVTARSWDSSTAVLRAWQRTSDGSWRLRIGPVRARVGYNGFVPADERRQSTGTSPAGTFAIVSSFGNGPDPGTALPYRAVDRSDWWTYDPRDPGTYNMLQPRRVRSSRWRTSWAEDLSGYGGQYRYVAVLDFNLPGGVHRAADGQRVADEPADTRRGGGIFLHVSGPGATAGCVSIPRDSMRRVLRWLDPVAGPVLVMGPRSAITRL
jgi:L,D-peptidoglycan transpeptidase YkuD (ErfK/YbiS/YcfS/YnhG family)